MKSYTINSETKTVEEVNIEGDTLEFAQKAVGGRICSAYVLENGDTFYCDDEGLLKPWQYAFEVDGADQPFIGNGIVMGCDEETGDTADVKTSLEDIKKLLLFFNAKELYMRYA